MHVALAATLLITVVVTASLISAYSPGGPTVAASGPNRST